MYKIFVGIFIYGFCMLAHTAELAPFEIPRTSTIPIQDLATNRDYELHIKLPLNYSEDKEYSVVYMTDSLYAFQIVSGATRYPINFKEMENLMFVGISWQKDFNAGLSRQRDYTPTIDSTNRFKDPTGQASQHLSFIQNDVFKYVETHYSVNTDNRTFIGNSFGGLFGAYALLTKPDLFKNYILGSSSFWYDDEVIFDFESSYFKENKTLDKNVFISVGSLEETDPPSIFKMITLSKQFYSVLESRNYNGLMQELRIIDHANHKTAFPTTAIQGLWWLFNTSESSEKGVALTNDG